MINTRSKDPRTIQTRQAFQQAFIELLQSKTYKNISVTDVARQAGYARHTFYNHYETLEDLLSNVIDSVLDDFFVELDKWNFNEDYVEYELQQTVASFFRALKDKKDLIDILKYLEFDSLFIERLKVYFTKFYYEHITHEIPSANISMAKYIISFNAYAFLGIVKPWLEDDMQYTPEIMAELLVQLTGGSPQRRRVIETFKTIIR